MPSAGRRKSMGTPPFHELKKLASFYIREKIRAARLALTDVTPAQLLAEEATNGNPSGPDALTMKIISRAAFETEDYWRIVDILHRRFSKFDRKHWRESYKALTVLEHLLTHGPQSASVEFQSDADVIRQLGSLHFIDERGFNWGLVVKKKSERVLKLLERGPLLREERERARELVKGIQGFGSRIQRSTEEEEEEQPSPGLCGRSDPLFFADHCEQEGPVESDQKENSSGGDVVAVSRLVEVKPEPLKENRSFGSRGPRVMENSSADESRPLLFCDRGGEPLGCLRVKHEIN